MERSEVADAVRNVYAARLSNDLEKCVDLFSLDGHFQLSGSKEGSSIAVSVSGKENIQTVLSELVRTWKWLDQEVLSTIIDGNRAAVHYRLRLQFQPTGQVIETEICDLLTFRSGELAEVIEFVDTALAASIMATA